MPESTLEALRAAGADRHDPVRFRYLEVLAGRLAGQPPAVQQLLQRRLQQALADYAGQVAQRAAAHTAAPVQPPGLSPLAQLNSDLQARVADPGAMPTGGLTGAAGVERAPPDLQSVRRFGEVWAQIAAEQQVAQAFTRGPENAGPLNAHRLVLRSLALMRTLSPDYLRHFVSQIDSLLWLEHASARPARAPLKPGKVGKTGRARR